MNPASHTALQQRDLIFLALGLMLVVLIPVWIMSVWFPLRYRESNSKATYDPSLTHNFFAEILEWGVPTIIVIIIGIVVWVYTHRLDPYKHVSEEPPITIQAINLDWKWVFLYPESKVATVNELVVPKGEPVEIKVTSDVAMGSLYVPGLVGQIYAMAGMQTKLNFEAKREGNFVGRNMQFTGEKFSEQSFTTRVVSKDAYAGFLNRLANAPKTLDAKTYDALLKTKDTSKVLEFSGYEPQLFHKVLMKYCATNCPRADVKTHGE